MFYGVYGNFWLEKVYGYQPKNWSLLGENTRVLTNKKASKKKIQKKKFLIYYFVYRKTRKQKLKMDKIDQAVLSLLVLGLIAAIIAGILYAFIKTKTGPIGDTGKTGPRGAPLPTIQASLLQLNTTNLPDTVAKVSQYTKTITIQVSGSINNGTVTPGSDVVVGYIPTTIAFPQVQVNANGFIDNILGITVFIRTNGEVAMNIAQAGTFYNFNITYSVS